jgi:hypothetical protein
VTPIRCTAALTGPSSIRNVAATSVSSVPAAPRNAARSIVSMVSTPKYVVCTGMLISIPAPPRT